VTVNAKTSPASTPTVERIRAALDTVHDPEIKKPITELGMVKDITISADGRVTVTLYLTVASCPLKQTLTTDTTAAVSAVEGVREVHVELDVMNDAQRTALRRRLRGDHDEPVIPFAQPGSLTKVYCVASGKGGVGKSSVTVNLAVALAARGLSVGVLDADIHGHSVPRMLGVTGAPVQIEKMIMPPEAHGIKVISVGMFTEGNAPVIWRGPMLHRALNQFLADVFWGELDILLLDLPPGTGDVAISLAQLIPTAEIIVVTTPQPAAAEVAERAGTIAAQTRQTVVGVIENMSWMTLPDGTRDEVFGAGGGRMVADTLSRQLGVPVPLLGQIPMDRRLREGGDSGQPLVLDDPANPAAAALIVIAEQLGTRPRGLAGRLLAVSPT
jgi:ATP-binding protein involved in chromosome partitioning